MKNWKWQNIYESYLDTVRSLTHNDEAIAFDAAQQVRDAWNNDGKTLISQHKTLMIQFRRRLKQELPSGHVGLTTLNLSQSEWTEANQSTTQRTVAQNQDQQLLSTKTVNAIVTRATKMLLSPNWRQLAIALAVLTGRRMTEIMKTAQWVGVSQYSVMFSGAVKRGGEIDTLHYEIPTLCLAEDVTYALKKLREAMPTVELSIPECNCFSLPLNQNCESILSDLIPAPSGRHSLNFHRLRGIYAAIATYFYCPPNVAEAEFRAHIMGHFEKDDGRSLRERRSLTSDRHYLSYAIQDDDGATRKGIRLGGRGVKVLTDFLPANAQPIVNTQLTNALPKIEELIATTTATDVTDITDTKENLTITMAKGSQKPKKRDRIDIWQEDKVWLTDLLDSLFSSGDWPTRMAQLLDWIDSILEEKEKAPPSPPVSSVSNSQTLETLMQEQAKTLTTLVEDIASLSKTMTKTIGYPEMEARITELEEEIRQLTQERDQIQAGLSQLQNSLTAAGLHFSAPPISVPPIASTATFGGISEATPEVKTNILSSPVSLASFSLNTSLDIPIKNKDDANEKNKIVNDVNRRDQENYGQVDPDVVQAIRLMMQHNDSTTQHRNKWRISTDPLRILLSQVGKCTTPKIMAGMKAMKQELDEHHRKHGLGQRHNRTHGGADKIKEIISLVEE